MCNGNNNDVINKQSDRVILTSINSVPIYGQPKLTLPANTNLRSRAVALRKAGNLPEIIFWKQVHKGKFYKIDFDRQKIVGNYIVDFYVKNVRLVIEIDGSSHEHKQVYDGKREAFLKSLGLKVYHIEDLRMKMDTENVMKELEQFIVENYG